jgi:hypothetical protein
MKDCLITNTLRHAHPLQQELQKVEDCIQAGAADNFLEAMLNFLALLFRVSEKYRKNIIGFQANYLFTSRDKSMVAAVVFDGGNMKVFDTSQGMPNVTVCFRDAKAFMGFLLSPRLDILDTMLKQDIVIEGNLNYLYKFVYMVNHPRHELWRLL